MRHRQSNRRYQDGFSHHFSFANAGISVPLRHPAREWRVALEAGNSPEVIFAHYRELVTPEAAEAWFKGKPKRSACFLKKSRLRERPFRAAPTISLLIVTDDSTRRCASLLNPTVNSPAPPHRPAASNRR